MQIRKPNKDWKSGETNTDKVLRDAYKAFRGNISFGKQGFNKNDINLNIVPDNLDCAFVKKTFGVPNTEVALTHNLNRVPIGFFCIRCDESATFWDSGTAWTTTQIFVESSANGVTATFIIF